jgi:endothelin-converting enzyme/putative endopeptidase
MLRSLLICIFAASSIAASQVQTQPAGTPGEAQPKSMKSFDVSLLDRSVDPCTDFYRFACGGWMERNPIPPDQAVWGRFNELAENNLIIDRKILEKAAAERPNRDVNQQKIGDYYASCMDETAIEKKGLEPLRPELDRIAGLQSKAELPGYLAHAHAIGSNAFFEFSSQPDYENAGMEIAETDQSGLGLPDRDYYFRTDPNSVALREKYIRHMQRMLELAGQEPGKAAANAKEVMAIETALAKASMDRVSRRDPARVYHSMTVADFSKLSSAFDWNRYIAARGAPKFDGLNVTVPEFVKGFNDVVANAELGDIKTYLTWRLLSTAASMLPRAFVDERFDFYGKTLTGAKELRPRWKRCVRSTDSDLGEALGKSYVEEAFGGQSKQRVLNMVHALEQALQSDIQELSWMNAETRKQALAKLAGVENKIGYPEKWRDYSSLKIIRGDALGNSIRANEFETHRQLAKIGNPVDRSEWGMSPPTVNAYYNSQENNINFPAGILQPPFFDMRADDAVNMGGIGAVIGHELTHGFDDQGRQFDAKGNLRDWWTAQDAKAFEERAQCFVDQYSKYAPVDDLHLNGKLTLGENVADNGGVRLALLALRAMSGMNDRTVEGFTPEQQFFVSFGQIWCDNARPEVLRLRTQVDSHSPNKFRVMGVLSNMPEFQKVFSCKPDSPMVSPKPCRVW